MSTTNTEEVEKDTEAFVQAVISSIPASKDYMDEYRKAQSQDTINLFSANGILQVWLA